MTIYEARVLNLGVSSDNPNLPSENDFVSFVPKTNLMEFWRSTFGLNLSDNNPVASWEGLNSGVMTQTSESRQPTYKESGISSSIPSVLSDGTDDSLSTSIAPPDQGVICVGFKTIATMPGALGALVGAGGGTNQISLGVDGGDRIAGGIGDVNFSALFGETLQADTFYVATLAWDSGFVHLRLNGELQGTPQEYTANLTDTALTIFSRSLSLFYPANVAAVAIYNAFITGETLTQIEAGVASACGEFI